MGLKVVVIGSGNWGSVITRMIGQNVLNFPDEFDPTVYIHVHEETINGRKLTEIINTDHENVKYLPGFKFPENVIAEADICKASDNADILIFVVPHQFLKATCKPLIGKIKSTAVGVSLIKGFSIESDGEIILFSELLRKMFNIDICVMMGANLANEIAKEQFSESTIGAEKRDTGLIIKRLVQTPYFRICVIHDIKTIEVAGSIKNIIACAAGFCDGLGYGDNTKAAVIRLGLKEMISFTNELFPGAKLNTFFESCGIADLITTCFGGRNRRVSEAFVKTKKPIAVLEKEMLNGQKLQGPQTAEEVFILLKKKNLLGNYPLLVVVHRICIQEVEPVMLIEHLKNHPAHDDCRQSSPVWVVKSGKVY